MASFTAKSVTFGGRVLMFGASLGPVRCVLHICFAKILANLCILEPDLYLFKIFLNQVYYKQLCRRCQVGFNPYRVESIICKVPLTHSCFNVNADFCVYSDFVL